MANAIVRGKMEREVTLPEMLAARELRAEKQDALLRKYQVPVISFSMNIAGPVKDTPLIRRAFRSGCEALKAALGHAGFPVMQEEIRMLHTGCEALYAVQARAEELKRLCVALEEDSPLGRLFDMDVLTAEGRKLERTEERRCLVCGMPGRGCASRRVHSVWELREATSRIMEEHFARTDRMRISDMVTSALIEEVRTTPKPGLVDLNNNGSHQDMTVETFLASAEALQPYWELCVEIGQETARHEPSETFFHLRQAGKIAERSMLAATNGVNTHKGAIYLLGVVCGALGRRWQADCPCHDLESILRECSELTRLSAEEDFAALAAKPSMAKSAGQRIFLETGLRGARGEAAEGLPSVARYSLPIFQQMLALGDSRNGAGVMALLTLIARGKDTNMIARGGLDVARQAAESASRLLENERLPSMEEIQNLDLAFIRQNLSPGGCADLLAVTYFLFDWCIAYAG